MAKKEFSKEEFLEKFLEFLEQEYFVKEWYEKFGNYPPKYVLNCRKKHFEVQNRGIVIDERENITKELIEEESR